VTYLYTHFNIHVHIQKEIMDIDEVVNKSANESKKFHYGKDGGVLKKSHTFFLKSLSWSTHIIQLEKHAFAALLDNSVKRKYMTVRWRETVTPAQRIV